jgi:hypothetical protein
MARDTAARVVALISTAMFLIDVNTSSRERPLVGGREVTPCRDATGTRGPEWETNARRGPAARAG